MLNPDKVANDINFQALVPLQYKKEFEQEISEGEMETEYKISQTQMSNL